MAYNSARSPVAGENSGTPKEPPRAKRASHRSLTGGGRFLFEELNIEQIGDQITADKDFIIYGFPPIRKELRDTPKSERLGRFNTRNLLLNLYDKFTKGRYLHDSLEIHQLALKFYNTYRSFGGIKNWQESNIDIDFTIVACASTYRLDLVISDDSRTLLSKPALKAYKHICVKDALWQPNFWKYSDLKVRYKF